MTVSALMVGLSIMIGVVVMVRSFRDTGEFWVDETVMADLIVAPQSWLHGKQAGQASRALPGTWDSTLSAIDGIAAVDTYREAYVGVEGQSVALVSPGHRAIVADTMSDPSPSSHRRSRNRKRSLQRARRRGPPGS